MAPISVPLLGACIQRHSSCRCFWELCVTCCSPAAGHSGEQRERGQAPEAQGPGDTTGEPWAQGCGFRRLLSGHVTRSRVQPRGCPALRPFARCGAGGRGGHAPCRLTQELLQHLAIVQVLLQLLHDDSLLHEDVVDPVGEDLGETQASRPRPPRQGPEPVQEPSCPRPGGPGQAGPEGQASPSPQGGAGGWGSPTPASQGVLWEFMRPQQRFSHCLDWASPWQELGEVRELSARGSGGAW